MPVAATLKVAVCPARTDWFCGCVVIAGGALVSSSAALELVTLPKRFVTMTE